jgi:hypothetical protein
MIRFHADDSMGFKGFSLSYVAVDPLDSDFDNSEHIEEEEESGEASTYIPGYFVGGSLKYNKNKEDDYEEPEETYKKTDENEKEDEDLVTDNEDNNYIYNSNRINKENIKILEKSKKPETIVEEDDDDDSDSD